MTRPTPPVAAKISKHITQLGRERVDDYAWLRDDSWQAVLRDPAAIRTDVKAHLEAENAYTQGHAGLDRSAAPRRPCSPR